MAVLLQTKLLSVLLVVVAAEFEYDPDILEASTMYQNYQQLKESKAEPLHFEHFINPEATVRLTRKNTIDRKVLEFEIDRTWVHNPGTVTKSTKCGGRPGLKFYKVYKEVALRNYSMQFGGPSRSLCFDGMQFNVHENDNGVRYMRMKMVFYTKTGRRVEVITNIFKPPKEDSPIQLGKYLKHAEKNGIPTIAYPFDVEENVQTSSKTTEKEKSPNITVDFNQLTNLVHIAKLASYENNLITRIERYLTTPIIVAYKLFDKILALHEPWKQYL